MDFGSIVNSATNAVSVVSNTLSSSGPASALSSISSAVSGVLSALSPIFKDMPGVKLPLKNPLFAYASYDYVLGIGVLTDNDVNFPDSSYMANKRIPLICKSANSDSNNRIQTPYGKFDFFIDNLVIESLLGHEKNNNTNATGIRFQITEPYSMGMFMISVQTAAYQAGWPNWREAPFLLTIDFRGNKETGQMDNISGTARKMPFKFTQIGMRVTGSGSIYTCEAVPYNQTALTSKHANLRSDVSVKGTTVIEMLQTGEKSLQVVMNQRLTQLKTDGTVAVPDEILILFPFDTTSAATSVATPDNKEVPSSATAAPKETVSKELFEKLGVVRSSGTINKTLIQPEGKCNSLGSASMGFDLGRKGDAPVGKDNQVYDPKLKVNVRANNAVDVTTSDFKFRQDTDVVNAINQVLLASNFPNKTFEPSNLTKEGYRGWWRIDVQTFVISSNENLSLIHI